MNMENKIKAILVERCADGEYERLAVTPEEFDLALSPMLLGKKAEQITDRWVTIYFDPYNFVRCRGAVVGDDSWVRFFADMSYGIPEIDAADGIRSVVRIDLMGILADYFSVKERAEFFARAFLIEQGIDPDE